MAALSMQHSKRLEEMIEQHKEELRKLEGIKDEELKVLLRYKRRIGGWVVLPIREALPERGTFYRLQEVIGKGFHKFRYMYMKE